MNDDIFGRIGLKYFIPSHHGLFEACDNLLDSGCENFLEGDSVFDAMPSHELLNTGILFPFLDVAFIASCVKVGIREESSHLANESAEKLVRAFACRINRRALRRILTASQVRVAHKP